MKNKILLLAYAISPTRGSEHSVSWNYVINMSKDNELVVLYGASGFHMGDVDEMNQYLKNNSVNNVRFIYVKPNLVTNFLNSLNKRNILVYTFYIAYNLWHKKAYSIAKRLIRSEHFDLIHYLGPIGYREPGYLWKLPLPYMWGPIGGTTNVPVELSKALSFAGKLKFGFRSIVNNLQLRFSTRVKNAISYADVLMAATTENQLIIKKIFNKDSIYIPENGIYGHFDNLISSKLIQLPLILIWIGTIDERKALIILLRSLIELQNLDKIQLHIIGEGSLKLSLQEFAINNNIDQNIVWHGAIKRNEVFKLLYQSHLHIITSVSEGNPTTIWEAMNAGVPTISLDHCGMHDTICEKCGIKIKIESYKQVINDLTYYLDYFVINQKELECLSKGVIECAKKYNWEQRREFFNRMYKLTIKNWKTKSKIN